MSQSINITNSLELVFDVLNAFHFINIYFWINRYIRHRLNKSTPEHTKALFGGPKSVTVVLIEVDDDVND